MNPVGPRALALLIRSLDAADSRIVAADLDPGERDAFALLQQHDAMVSAADVAAVLCPWCGEHDVAPQRRAGRLQALCPECGYVAVTNPVLQAWTADPDWMLGRLRGAFGIAARQASTVLVPDTLWQVGQATTARRTRRVLFTRRLAQDVVLRVVRASLQASVPLESAVLIGTTARAAARLDGLDLPYLGLAEIVRWRSGKLELDDERWERSLRTTSPATGPDAGVVFSNGYRRALVVGVEYRFSVLQASFFEHLARACGEKCHKDSIMASIGSPQKNPAELFRKNRSQQEGFHRLVEQDQHGYYWLQRR